MIYFFIDALLAEKVMQNKFAFTSPGEGACEGEFREWSMIWQQVQRMKGTSFTAYLPMFLNNLYAIGLKHFDDSLAKNIL